jgi:serine/threonine protein kinase
MSEGQNGPDLRVLDERYERQGELRGSDGARTYFGKRREDGADVTITIVQAANGGENNALSHLASDTQMLGRISHPNVPRSLDGKWIGKDTFAVVRERVRGTTLSELLSSGERFPYPRISIVLQRVSAVLDWAREQGLVHRGVTADNLLFEQGTHRPVMTLALTPIPLGGVPDAGADARTVGLLAWSMLTGKPLVGEPTEEALLALRPDLAKRVVDDTLAMVRSKSGVAPPDVQDFLAVIATGDALKTAEVEIARIQAELLEERRIERETIAAERVAERERHEAEVRAAAERAAEIEQRLADERVEFERRKAEEEAQFASTEQQLAAERLQFEQERLELEERNAELAAARADVDKLKADEERRIAAAVAAAVAAAKASMPSPVYDDQSYIPDELDESGIRRKAFEESVVGGAQPWEVPATEPEVGRPRWMMPAVVTGVLVVLIAIAAIVNYRSGGALPGVVTVGKETVVPTPPSTDAGRAPRGGFMSQSAGGNVVSRVGPPLASTDTSKSRAVTPAAPRDSLTSNALSDVERDSIARQDSIIIRRERALIRERALRRARERDSLARRDSLAKRDSLLMRRDTTRFRPDTLTR